MKTPLRSLVACVAALFFAGVASAEDPLNSAEPAGTATVDFSVAFPSDAAPTVLVVSAEFPLESTAPAGTATVEFTATAPSDRQRPVATVEVAPVAAPSVYTPQPAEHLGEANCPRRPWAVIAPYAWIFGMHGQVGARGRVLTVDQSVSDAVDAAVDDMKGALGLHVEAGYGQSGLIADLTYFHVVPLDGFARFDSKAAMFELLGFYRVRDGCREPGAVTLDVLAGVRYYHFSNDLQVVGVDPLPIERTSSWTDLIVGARAEVQLLDKLGVFVRGDIGGFGIGHASRQTCNVIAGFECQLLQHCSFYAGYRWLKIDRSSGAGRDAFLLDATLAGPFIALGARF